MNRRNLTTFTSRWVRSAAIVCAAILPTALVNTNVAIGQQLTPILQSDQSEIESAIEKIYQQTKTAESLVDFSKIVKQCEELKKQTLPEKNEVYLNSLVSWARNKLGQKHLENATAMRKIGLIAQSDQELERAAEQFDFVIENSPKTWRAWLGRAETYAIAGRYELALEKYLEVTKRRSSHLPAWFNSAEIHLHLGHFQAAIDIYTRLIKEDPTDVQALSGRGHAFLAERNVAAAIDDYKTVHKLFPNDETAMCNLADAYVADEQWTAAKSLLEKAAKLPKATIAVERLSWLLVESSDKSLRDSERVIAVVEKWLATNKPTSKMLNHLAAAYSAQGMTQKANQTRAKAKAMVAQQIKQKKTELK